MPWWARWPAPTSPRCRRFAPSRHPAAELIRAPRPRREVRESGRSGRDVQLVPALPPGPEPRGCTARFLFAADDGGRRAPRERISGQPAQQACTSSRPADGSLPRANRRDLSLQPTFSPVFRPRCPPLRRRVLRGRRHHRRPRLSGFDRLNRAENRLHEAGLWIALVPDSSIPGGLSRRRLGGGARRRGLGPCSLKVACDPGSRYSAPSPPGPCGRAARPDP